MRRMIILSALMVLGITQAVQGQVPRTLSYQGVLKDSVGTIVPDDDYDFIFRIYDVPSGGVALWAESYYPCQKVCKDGALDGKSDEACIGRYPERDTGRGGADHAALRRAVLAGGHDRIRQRA